MSSETAISRWLRKEMPQRGYPIGGRRSGGISRLAEDAGIPQASMSRIVNGDGEPSLDALRKIGKALRVPLNELLIHAGFATEDDFTIRTVVGPARLDGDPRPEVHVPSYVPLEDLGWERNIWLTPQLTVAEREAAVYFLQLVRGDLVGEGDRVKAILTTLQAIVGKSAASPTPLPRA